MRKIAILVGAISCVTAPLVLQAKGNMSGAAISAALSSSDRPVADTARDADRKPAVLIAFSGVKAGDKVADLIPGKGYFTRIFSKIVGAKGAVYAVEPAEMLARMPKALDEINSFAGKDGFSNVSAITSPSDILAVPAFVDVAFTSQNYHDVYGGMGVDAAAKFNAAVFKILRPGGVYVVIDHVALAGEFDKKLHRIDPDVVKKQVSAAGFVLVGESTVLRNTADPHNVGVFSPELRGHTDQFVLKFRKPGGK